MRRSTMHLLLAPMEGLTDVHMRDVLTRLGRYDWCVTEFIRVTDRCIRRGSKNMLSPVEYERQYFMKLGSIF